MMAYMSESELEQVLMEQFITWAKAWNPIQGQAVVTVFIHGHVFETTMSNRIAAI